MPTRPNHRPLACLSVLLGIAMPAGTASTLAAPSPPEAEVAPSPQPTERVVQAGRHRLARLLSGTALDLMQLPEPSSGDFRVALALSEWATELAPDWADGWRVLLRLAAAAEGLDDRTSDRMREALSSIVRLDPRDEVARLRLLSIAVERFDTVEDRLAAYDRLLEPSNLSKLGTAVAARLAFESAMLLYRSGDVDAFAERLAESVALDPSYPPATEMAAGFLRHNLDDPVGEAELFAAAALANPSNLLPLETLASISLRQGAYRAAARLFGLLVELAPVESPESAEATAGLALARWALGEPQAAVDLIDARQAALDQVARDEARRRNPGLGPLESEQVRAPPERQLASVKAVIQRCMGSGEADAALAVAMLALRLQADQVMKRSEESEARSRRLATLALEGAGLVLWLGEDVGASQRMLEELNSMVRLSASVESRFEGWLALQNDDPAAALEAFDGDDPSPLATVGRAEALERTGRRRDAARLHLANAREASGTVYGVWSRDRLSRLLEREVPPSETAAAIDSVVAEIPRTYDRLLLDRERAVSLTLRPPPMPVDPLEPLVIEVELANLTDLPLAIDAVGPIEPNLAILATAQVPQIQGTVQADPMVVPIGRRLRLEPRERVVVPIDLGLGPVGDVLERTAISGSTVQARAISNFRPVPGGALQPGMLGAKAQGPQIRVDGVRVSSGWLEDSVAAIRTPDEPQDLVLISLLAAVGAATETNLEAIPEGEFAAITEIFPSILAAWPLLGPAGQGWLLATLPALESKGIDEIVAVARRSDETLTILGYVLGRVRSPDDPVLLEALASDDPRLRTVAELVARRVGASSRRPAAQP